MKKLRALLFCLALIFGLLVNIPSALSQGDYPDIQLSDSQPVAPILDSALNQLIAAYTEGGQATATSFGAQHGLRLTGNNVQVTILATLEKPDIEAIKRAVLLLGGEVQTWWQDEVQALVPISQLTALGDNPAVRFVRPPLRGVPDATTEGDAAIHADTYRSVVGSDGAGIKVAVLDIGFRGLANLQTSGELPSTATVRSFRADGLIDDPSVTNHGAGCAEIVYDLAPGATYYFVTYETSTEFANAVSYLESEGVQVVSHSISFFNAGPYDGGSSISQRIDTAKTNGIAWLNSAGNRGLQHWEGNYNGSAATSNFHIWYGGSQTYNMLGGGATLPFGSQIAVYLSWDAWPATNDDYDLYLFSSDGSSPWTPVAESTTTQNGSQTPTEQLNLLVLQEAYYAIGVQNRNGDAAPHYLELFTVYQNLKFNVESGSVPNAGDAAGAITIGAVDVSNYSATGLEGFSGRGPTNAVGGGAPDYQNGSRTKPDLAGPDRVSTDTYGSLGFGGTSASTPHSAGAAVLYAAGYLSAFGSAPSPDQTQSYLENCADTTLDWGTDIDGEKNNDYGAGGLYLCQTPTVVELISMEAHHNLTDEILASAFALLLIAIGIGFVQHNSRGFRR